MIIRPATPADARAIAAIYAPAVLHGTASFELEPPDEAEMARRIAAVLAGNMPYLVAVDAGGVLGYAYASAFRPRPAYRFACENSIYVLPDAQGKGVGRALLAELLGRCTSLGLRQMMAVIGDSQNFGSINLHRRAGFTFSGTMHAVGFKHGRWLDVVTMQRALGDGETTPPA
jgi:phosphinothricin acetyltransferase